MAIVIVLLFVSHTNINFSSTQIKDMLCFIAQLLWLSHDYLIHPKTLL